MKWMIDSSSTPFYVRVETSGVASPQEFQTMWDEILESDFWCPGLTVLMDNRKLKPLKDADAFTSAAIEYFTKNAARIGRTCISTISEQPENFKYARQFQYGIRLRGSDVTLQVFASETQAVEWLNHYSSLHIKQNQVTTAQKNQN